MEPERVQLPANLHCENKACIDEGISPFQWISHHGYSCVRSQHDNAGFPAMRGSIRRDLGAYLTSALAPTLTPAAIPLGVSIITVFSRIAEVLE